MIQETESNANGLFEFLRLPECFDAVKRRLSNKDKYALSLVSKEIRDFILTVSMELFWLQVKKEILVRRIPVKNFGEWLGMGRCTQEKLDGQYFKRANGISQLKFFATAGKISEILMWPVSNAIVEYGYRYYQPRWEGRLARSVGRLFFNFSNASSNWSIYSAFVTSLVHEIHKIVGVFSSIDEGSAASNFIDMLEDSKPMLLSSAPWVLHMVALLYMLCDKKVERIIKENDDKIDSLEETLELNLKM